MKIIFISGVEFGYSILKHILEQNWKIDAIFSYNESKFFLYSDMISFDNLASKYKIKIFKVDNINDPENVDIIKQIEPDIILVMGWSQILKSKIIQIPNIGVIGSHPTELPKYRGRAPIPWSILKNLKESALTFFWIEEGTDTGYILDQKKFFISNEDDATSLYKKITKLGKKMIIKNLDSILKGKFSKIKQNESEFIENWPKRTIEDGFIDWSKSAEEIHTLIRASTYPYPGAFTYFQKKKLVIWKSLVIKKSVMGWGEILNIDDNGIEVSTGNGILKLIKVEFDNNDIDIFSKKNIGEILNK
jgi:methionyl-tRNA formyltransferase